MTMRRSGALACVAVAAAAMVAWAQPPDKPRRGPGGPGGSGGSSMLGQPQGRDEAEKKALKAIEEISKEQGFQLNVPPVDGRMLRLLAETTGARNAVEIGTSNGISGIWLGMALKKVGGRLTTHELDPKRAAQARANFQRAGVGDVVTVVEGDAHETVKKLQGPIDLVFIDADKEGYLDYLTKVLPLVKPGGLILAHNITPRMADTRYLKAVTQDPALETLIFSDGGGLSLTLKKR